MISTLSLPPTPTKPRAETSEGWGGVLGAGQRWGVKTCHGLLWLQEQGEEKTERRE